MEKKVITDSAVISSIREAMPVATAEDKGLMPAGLRGIEHISNSMLIFKHEGAEHQTTSLFVSVCLATGYEASLYYVSLSRNAQGVTMFRVKVLSGTYAVPLVAKFEEGQFLLYTKREEYTPVVGCLVVSCSGTVSCPMTVVDNAELEDATEATLEE